MPLDQWILTKYPNGIFVETGTYQGATVDLAFRLGFGKVISVEIDPGHYRSAVERYKDNPRVHIFHGNSRGVLGDILKVHVGGPATIWLDAHGDVFGYNPEGNTTPILDELRAIRGHPVKGHTILIDDLRIFRARSGWARDVSEEDVIREIHRIGPYGIFYEDDEYSPRDVLVAAPL